MVEPADIVRERKTAADEAVSALRHEYQLVEKLGNVDDKVRRLEGLVETDDPNLRIHSGQPEMSGLVQEMRDRLFDLRDLQELLGRIEDRLGQAATDPVDLTLQQTLDIVGQLRQAAESIPNDERMSTIGTNVCEGLESFVTSVLSSPPADEAGGYIGPGPADLTMTLEVIETVRSCPGGDRTAIYSALRQQFLDAACHSTWSRVNRLFDRELDRAGKKQYLHEALTIWTLLPDLSENAGSPRLSQLPAEMRSTIEQVLLRQVIGPVEAGGTDGLLEAALLTKELADDYLSMVPAIPLEEEQTALGLQAGDSLIRRVRSQISAARSWDELETCQSAMSVIRTIKGLEADERLDRLSWPLARARLRLRLSGLAHGLRRLALPALAVAMVSASVAAGYVGLAYLLERLYDTSLPLAP